MVILSQVYAVPTSRDSVSTEEVTSDNGQLLSGPNQQASLNEQSFYQQLMKWFRSMGYGN
jgi:hypothetical protein